ncbi:MAG TPA: alpha/beta hydrolase [Streptosporangiaceae bacterium]|nr:alpha/beta hydrolase [Streptosporangiaceae bacterium]
MPTTTTADGRTLCYQEWGDPGGAPLFHLHGTPGCRLSRHPDLTVWSRLRLRVVTIDRPGYGQSTALPGRTVSHAAGDVAAAADALGVGRFMVVGGSGGGPHALACAAGLGDRVLACASVCSAAPLQTAEIAGLIGTNREGLRVLSEEGRRGTVAFLSGLRDRLLADPVAEFSAEIADSPAADLDWNGRADVQAVRSESLLEALRPGVDGWADDVVSLFADGWGIDMSAVGCPTRFWHSDDDRNSPLSAVERLVAQVPGASLRTWHGEGHSAPSRHMEDVLRDLIEMARARS